MANLVAYDPTRGYTVPIAQARVVAWVIDADTGVRYNTVAEAVQATAPVKSDAAQAAIDEAKATTPTVKAPTSAPPVVPTSKSSMGAVGRGEYTQSPTDIAAVKATEQKNANTETTITKAVVQSNQDIENARVNAEGGYAGPNSIGKLAGLVNASEYNEDYVNEFVRNNPDSFDKETVTNAVATAESIIINKPEFKENPAFVAAQSILSQYNISGFILALSKIREDYPNADSDTIVQLFQYDDRYNGAFLDRFSGNKTRKSAGLPMLSGADYLKMEQGYKKVFTSYGLDRFNNLDYYAKLIGNDSDVVDITDRLALGYTRLVNDPTTLNTFNKFFPSLDTTDIFAAMMDPEQQIPELKRKITAAEIGGQAASQALTSSYAGIDNILKDGTNASGYSNVQRGTLGANVLGNAGVTEATAKTGYQNIAEVLPISEKLSSIYSTTAQQYGQKEAEQEQFLGLESAARKRRKLSELEKEQFGGSSGTSRGSFSTGYLNKQSSTGQF